MSFYKGLEWKVNILKLHQENTKYCIWETRAIENLYHVVGIKPKSISDEYFVPYSTVVKIWNLDSNRDNEDDSAGESYYWKYVWEELVLDYIQAFLRKVEYIFTSNDISEKIKEDLDIEIDNWYIRETLKNKFGLSFKRVTSRPSNKDSYKNKMIRKLFAVGYLNKLSGNIWL